mmetsp:Transcript_1680/g.3125  ORF Transcript_1680/g.3125 Transcript_1680/m.3125 type:complete len:903 (-) Transcript_1680:2372-5080(-)
MPRDDDEGKESNEKEANENKQDMTKKVYGDYEILKAIGKGKFAVVYRAKRKSDGEIVALKRISVDTVDDKTREKCLKEVKLLQSLDHPNIIRYMDSFINDNDLVIVFEWAAAGDLKRQLRKAQEKETPFEERIIWKYFSQIADAIQHMHERRIMHRDLKPANIFLTLDGTVKLGDLGLSRELSDNTLQAHSKVGTPLYMSPEVLRGDGYDFKSDIWSIGCLLYELAMLKSPFKSEGLNLYSLFQKISKGEYSPLPERYSEELRTLACSMISTNSEDRPEIGDICEIAARMRTKYTDEYVKQRRLSKQREREASMASITRTETEDKSDGGEDKSVTSNASSKTASRHKPNRRQRGVYERQDSDERDDRDDDDRQQHEEHDRGRYKIRQKGSDDTADREHDREQSRDQDRGGGRGFMSNAGREDPHESSFPSFQKTTAVSDRGKESVDKYNNMMDNLRGDEYHSHSDKRTNATGTEGGNRFSDQALGHSGGSRDSSDWGGSKGKKRDKHKLDHSHGSSGDNISLPKNNLNGKVNDNGRVFAHDEHRDSAHNQQSVQNSYYSSNNRNNYGQSPQHGGYQNRSNNQNNPQDNPYVIPVADQRDHSSSKKPEMKVQRRKKDVSEQGGGHQSSRRGNSSMQVNRQHTPPKNSGRGFHEDEDLTAASPLQTTNKMPSNSYRMSGVALAQMEILYGKLTLLKFPIYLDTNSSNQRDNDGGVGVMQCRLCPLHFAGDLASILGRRAHEFPATQFHTYVQVAEWLILKARGSLHEDGASFSDHFTIDVYNDSPGSIAKQLLRMAQDAGVPQDEMSEITPTNLSTGHGDNACVFLNLLANVAIMRCCKKQEMVYPTDTVEGGGVDLNEELDDDVVEVCNFDISLFVMYWEFFLNMTNGALNRRMKTCWSRMLG